MRFWEHRTDRGPRPAQDRRGRASARAQNLTETNDRPPRILGIPRGALVRAWAAVDTLSRSALQPIPMGTFHIYCDESCHLEHDGQRAMVVGALVCPARRTRDIAARIRELKNEHCVATDYELKWTKASPSRLDLYLAAIDYFFQEPDLTFRAFVVPDKSVLDHARHGQDHATFYFKAYYYALRPLVQRAPSVRIFLDVKDTRSGSTKDKLHDVLCTFLRDRERERVRDIQFVRSEEVQQVQLADLLVGAVSYANRHLTTSEAKLQLVRRVEERAGLFLTRQSPLRAQKLNVFVWKPTGAVGE
jgi:hypothetical protein